MPLGGDQAGATHSLFKKVPELDRVPPVDIVPPQVGEKANLVLIMQEDAWFACDSGSAKHKVATEEKLSSVGRVSNPRLDVSESDRLVSYCFVKSSHQGRFISRR
jgi:hypothetical protein